jgi:hypothetical protein
VIMLVRFLITQHASLLGYLLMLSELGPYRLNMMGRQCNPRYAMSDAQGLCALLTLSRD